MPIEHRKNASGIDSHLQPASPYITPVKLSPILMPEGTSASQAALNDNGAEASKRTLGESLFPLAHQQDPSPGKRRLVPQIDVTSADACSLPGQLMATAGESRAEFDREVMEDNSLLVQDTAGGACTEARRQHANSCGASGTAHAIDDL